MVLSPMNLTRKSPQLFRFVAISGNSARNQAKPVLVTGFRCSTSSCYQSNSLNCSTTGQTWFKQLCRTDLGFKQFNYGLFRISAVSDGGSGGSGGTGGSGGGDSGGGNSGEGDGGKSKWSLLSWYMGLLQKYPVLTKAVTSALLTFVGDLVCQLAIDQVTTVDLKRIFIFTFLGLALVGPTLHFWYLYLSKLVTMSGASGAFLRLIVDQFIFAPIFIGVFLSTLVTLEGRPSEVIPKLQQEWFSSVIANWQLWIPFQFLNFRFVPQQFQVLAANFIAVVWNVILSYKAHKEVVTK